MTYARVEQAARNNAVWCETVCRVHGTPGEFYNVLWLNRHPVPRFYPNVVTLSTQGGDSSPTRSYSGSGGCRPPWQLGCQGQLLLAGFDCVRLPAPVCSHVAVVCTVPAPPQPGGFRSPLDLGPERVRTGKVGNGVERQASASSIHPTTACLSSSTAGQSRDGLHRRLPRSGTGGWRRRASHARSGWSVECLCATGGSGAAFWVAVCPWRRSVFPVCRWW